ncbi:MAG: hypothetical protein CFE21_06525 [Bacteroidetes bacterium B1(2017)]|nr:MAG: hypothetical protein CFE21_06525 [Bacteroidetes bacterium B1(2017)]
MNTIPLKWHGLKWACMLFLCLIIRPSVSIADKLNSSLREDKTIYSHTNNNSIQLLTNTNSTAIINLDIDPQLENIEAGIPDDPGNPDAPIDSEIVFLILAGLGLGFYSSTKLKANIN